MIYYFISRQCGGVFYIPKVARGYKTSADVNKVKHDISAALKIINQTKHSIKKSLLTADDEKKTHLKQIHDVTDSLIKHVRGLQDAAVDEVNAKHKTTTDKLQSEINNLDDAETRMKGRLRNLENAKINTDAQVFIDIKRGRQELESVRELGQKVNPNDARKAMPEFVVSDGIIHFLNDVCHLGYYVDKKKASKKKAYTATLYNEYYIGMKKKDSLSCITGSCELPDGTILLTDFSNNSCIRKLDASYKVTECLEMPKLPMALCQTSPDDVAVAICNEKKVQFVNIRGRLKKTRSFPVEECCRGICYSRDQLVVACGGWEGNECSAKEGPGFVAIYNVAGYLLRKFQLDKHGRQIFSQPRRIIATSSGDKFHVADRDGGIITIDRQGCMLSSCSEMIEGSYGLCAVTENDLLVIGNDSNNVVQIDTDGRMIAVVIGMKDGIKWPTSLLFLRDSSMLILTEWNSDNIKVFKVRM